MKCLRFGVVILGVILAASSCRATSPPPEKTLEQRVEAASHVFIGVVKNIKVVQVRDGKVREVFPMPAILHPGQSAELEIEVKEVLYPTGYKPIGNIKYLFGEGMFSVSSIRKDTIAKELIYLLKSPDELGLTEPYFLPSWPWNLSSSLDFKSEIQAMLEKRKERATKKE